MARGPLHRPQALAPQGAAAPRARPARPPPLDLRPALAARPGAVRVRDARRPPLGRARRGGLQPDRAVRARRQLGAVPHEGAHHRRVVRADHLLGRAGRPVGRDHRGPLPLLRDDRRSHPVPGLDAVPGRDRLRGRPPRCRRRDLARVRVRQQHRRRPAPVGVGADPRRIRARGERRPRGRLADQREPAAARSAHRPAQPPAVPQQPQARARAPRPRRRTAPWRCCSSTSTASR